MACSICSVEGWAGVRVRVRPCLQRWTQLAGPTGPSGATGTVGPSGPTGPQGNNSNISLAPILTNPAIYPVNVSAGNATVYSFTTNVNPFLDILYAEPITTGAGRAVSIDVKETVKTKINKIKEIRTEPTTALDYIYPVEVSADIANVLPLQAVMSSYMYVDYALPVSTCR